MPNFAPRSRKVLRCAKTSAWTNSILRDLQGGRRALQGGDPPGAARKRRDGEAAGVAEAVEHFAPGRKRAHALPVFPLVEEEAGFLALLDVDAKVQSVLDDRAARRRTVAAREADALRQPFELSDFRIGALEDRFAIRNVLQSIEDALAPVLGARGKKLRHEHVGIAVHDQAGQAVGFAVHQPHRIAVLRGRQLIPYGNGMLKSSSEKLVVDRFRNVETPYPRPDLGGRAVGGKRERLAGGVPDFHRFAGIRFSRNSFHGTGKDPWMAALQ
jgi:hypothetical protein